MENQITYLLVVTLLVVDYEVPKYTNSVIIEVYCFTHISIHLSNGYICLQIPYSWPSVRATRCATASWPRCVAFCAPPPAQRWASIGPCTSTCD